MFPTAQRGLECTVWDVPAEALTQATSRVHWLVWSPIQHLVLFKLK